ncbi:hypothetical protein DPEC_G00125690 [Dallia pectoralis]|uniref:Uncharacterized protein n=1 Tax=Dallia pectoralis TaxID=75939 RepID=A0ACC2GR07_DALPE|nr:hypothetical protein DPEC_G00125690 [Dallia pectoralis]
MSQAKPSGYSGYQQMSRVPCATAVDVNTAELPSTPCLIILGVMMKPSGWLISIEGHVVMGPHPFFLHGVEQLLRLQH